MKLAQRIGVWLAAVGVFGGALALWAGTTEVFRVRTTVNGVIQRSGNINKVIITSDDLVNLASARELGTPVPPNEILALVTDCTTNNLRLVVFDTAGSSNLVTVGTLGNLAATTSARRRYAETITQVTVADTSVVVTEGATNGVTGGSFYYHGKINIDTNGCPVSFGGQLTGFLGTAFPMICTNITCTNVYSEVIKTNCPPITNAAFRLYSILATNPPCTNVITTMIVTNCPLTITNIFPCTDAITVIIPRAPIITGKSVGTFQEP